jgi:hypothetical protein
MERMPPESSLIEKTVVAREHAAAEDAIEAVREEPRYPTGEQWSSFSRWRQSSASSRRDLGSMICTFFHGRRHGIGSTPGCATER